MLNKNELKIMLELLEQDVLKEKSECPYSTEEFKQFESYKNKKALYEKLASEYYERTMTINEESIFGLLDFN